MDKNRVNMALLATGEVLMLKTTVLRRDLEPVTLHFNCVKSALESLQAFPLHNKTVYSLILTMVQSTNN